MIRFLRLTFWRLFRLIQLTVVTPVLIGGVIVFGCLGAMVGALVAFPFAYTIFRTDPGQSAWELAVYIPFMLAGAVVGAAGWIDPKGENARITWAAREDMGAVHVLDPFEVSGRPSAAYNPLDRLSADSPDLSEDATSLADALVVDPASQVGDAHWNEEAKAFLGGLIMFCVELMQDSDAADGLVARAANRFAGKAEREAASVLSNAQRHTHFLDSPRIAKCMARSDFHFSDLRHRITSVFLVLPPNRLDAYSRWLRLLVSQALQDIARDAERPLGPQIAAQPPVERLKAPALFLLDEFAALGRLEAVERAMGLMAGYGLQLWPILQDMSQLRDLYGQRASTFVANAGVQQVFGVNDFETAKWLSQTMGQGTIGYQTESHKPGDMPTTGTSITGRDLLTPDEIMQLPPELQLLRVQGQPTAIAGKLRYYADREFEGLFSSRKTSDSKDRPL